MSLDEPRWWYGDERDWRAVCLAPAALLYGRLVARRLRVARPYRSTRPVVCLGNFTVGGTGKTPLALEVATLLEQLGHAPWFLTRGYRGRISTPHQVVLDKDSAADVGDEPLLLASRAPTLVARDRAAGARLIEARSPSNAVIVMDDGLQNPGLVKDLSMAVVDAGRGLGNGRVLPAGPLRARIEVQAAIVDALVIARAPDVPEHPSLSALRERFAGRIVEVETVAEGDVDWLRGARVVAFAAIGNPARFHRLLRRAGAELCEVASFPDHHPFSQAEAERLIRTADDMGATLVTTAKDMARLASGTGALAELRSRSRVLAVKTRLDAASASLLTELLATAIRRSAGQA